MQAHLKNTQIYYTSNIQTLTNKHTYKCMYKHTYTHTLTQLATSTVAVGRRVHILQPWRAGGHHGSFRKWQDNVTGPASWETTKTFLPGNIITDYTALPALISSFCSSMLLHSYSITHFHSYPSCSILFHIPIPHSYSITLFYSYPTMLTLILLHSYSIMCFHSYSITCFHFPIIPAHTPIPVLSMSTP